jgi:hypothetical protein
MRIVILIACGFVSSQAMAAEWRLAAGNGDLLELVAVSTLTRNGDLVTFWRDLFTRRALNEDGDNRLVSFVSANCKDNTFYEGETTIYKDETAKVKLPSGNSGAAPPGTVPAKLIQAACTRTFVGEPIHPEDRVKYAHQFFIGVRAVLTNRN